MSRKNFKVATTEDGKTTLIQIDKTPTGKVKTIKDKEKIRKEREEQYKNFRINALKRRAARMKMPQEQIDQAVQNLIAQLNTPNSYTVLIFFNSENADIIRQAFLNEGLAWNVMSNSHMITVADQEALATIRGILPKGTKIHTYVRKKPAILPAASVKSEKKQKKGGKPNSRLNGKKEKRKRYNIARLSKQEKLMFKKEVKTLRDLWKADKKKTGTTVQLKPKKGSNAPKKASTNLKKAA